MFYAGDPMSFKNAVSVTFVFFISVQAFAWGNDGHSIVGYIAEKNLTPAAEAMLQDIIGMEPMALTATWADLVRNDVRFKKFTAYHFYEIPVNFTAANIPANLVAEKDAHTVILQGPDKILSDATPRPEKIIWLRYLIHVVGDVHQPLHVGNGIDMGGNLCLIRWQKTGSSREEEANLHSFWDTKLPFIVGEDYKVKNPVMAKNNSYFGYTEIADLILKEYGSEISMSSANKASQDEWYEGARALHAVVYPDARPTKNPETRPYCRIVDKQTGKVVDGKFSSRKLPTISKTYLNKALPVVKKQLLIAGYRLAGLLNSMGEKYVPSSPRGNKEFNISDVILLNKDFRMPQSETGVRSFLQTEFPDCDHGHN